MDYDTVIDYRFPCLKTSGARNLMQKKILVVGVGSAGLLTLAQMLSGLDHQWDVHSVYDPKIPILGVGEATSTNTPYSLFKGTDFILARDGHYLDATLKHSVKYTNWRENVFDSWIAPPAYALHFDNTKLKDFIFMRLKEKYSTRFLTIEGNVEHLRNIENGVEVKINDQISTYDYVIDCSGFPKDYTDYTMVDLPINHALVTPIQTPGDWNYTHHWAHKNGWMFGIPLQSRQGWGYMYNDTITSKEDAMSDMCNILKIDPAEQKFREYTFKPFYAGKNLIDGRILKNGNRFMFFEPMEALSMEAYTSLNIRYILWINGRLTKDKVLHETEFDAGSLVRFYRFVYHGGSNYNTEFWKTTKRKCKQYLQDDPHFSGMIKFWKDECHIPDSSFGLQLQPFPAWVWENFDKNLGYNYFIRPPYPTKHNVIKKPPIPKSGPNIYIGVPNAR